MRNATWLMALGLGIILISTGTARAEDAPAAGTDGGAVGGIRQLPGTIQKDVGDAVKKDMGMGGTPAAPREPSKADTDDADVDDDEADE